MKWNFINFAVTIALCTSSLAMAQEAVVRPQSAHVFMMGLCVGQALAAEQVVVSLPPTAKPDAATDAAFKTAVHNCESKIKSTNTPAS